MMTKYKLTLTKTIDDDDPLMDFCYDDTTEQLAPVELMADELKRMFDCGYVDALNVTQDAAWSVEEVGNNLAHTIPADEITLGRGEPVFPALRLLLSDFPAVLELINQREQYGIDKYGQTLMTDDDRDTAIEIANEMADTLAYMQKCILQHKADGTLINDGRWIDSIMRRQIELCAEMLEYIEVVNAPVKGAKI